MKHSIEFNLISTKEYQRLLETIESYKDRIDDLNGIIDNMSIRIDELSNPRDLVIMGSHEFQIIHRTKEAQ